jgi:SAM-dependent methyltransferase
MTMKLRDSGMPDEQYWESLFDVGLIVSALGINSSLRDVAELGCGYGTFTIPIARAVSVHVYTFDIDPAMVCRTEDWLKLAGHSNVVCRQRDVMEDGFGLSGIDAALLFNILHCENLLRLLNHTADAVHIGGWVFVIHWRFDLHTPRGPSLDIRPKPKQIIEWAHETGRLRVQGETIDLPPWHYRLRFKRA